MYIHCVRILIVIVATQVGLCATANAQNDSNSGSPQISSVDQKDVVSSECPLEGSSFKIPPELGAAAKISPRKLAEHSPTLLPPRASNLSQIYVELDKNDVSQHEVVDRACQDMIQRLPFLEGQEEQLAKLTDLWGVGKTEVMYLVRFKYKNLQYQIYGKIGGFVSVSVVFNEKPEELGQVIRKLIKTGKRQDFENWLEKQNGEKRNKDYVYKTENTMARFGWRRQSRESASDAVNNFFAIRVAYVCETKE